VQELVYIGVNFLSVVLKDHHLYEIIFLSFLRREYGTEVVDKAFNWHQPILRVEEVNRQVEMLL
jgi:hypothetical protein